MSLAVLLSIGSVGITGCGNSAKTNNTPTVENGGDIDGNDDLSRYTNAEWLYENYFGEYGFPIELKTKMLPELKMLANGFSLQFALEKDPEAVVEKFNTVMLALKVSGKFDMFAKELMTNLESGEYVFDDANSSVDNNVTIQISDPRITEEAQEHINQAQKEQAIYKKEQEDLVKKYNLPYPLPERITKVIIYSALMGKKGTKKTNHKQPRFKKLESFNWYHGEWFYVNAHRGYKYAKIEYGHVGIIDVLSSSSHMYAIDAMPDDGVRAHWDLNKYFSKYEKWTRVEAWGYYPDLDPIDKRYMAWSETDYRRYKIVNWARSKIGKAKYDLFSTKRNKDEVYCSSFVWQAWMNVKVNLAYWPDSLFVYPKHITSWSKNRYVNMFNSETRPSK